MSGTSCDGLDLALCNFDDNDFTKFTIIKTKTYEYDKTLKDKLKNTINLNVLEFIQFHKEYGRYIAEKILDFLENENADIISIHGHTIVHLPHKKANFQLGDGATIAAITKKPVVCDFRSVDIALNGQGAPLVPIGDLLLFPQYDALINLGGFSNITIKKPTLQAFDICPVNYALNFFANKLNYDFDLNGNLGQQGKIVASLLEKLNSIEYYQIYPPKSLSDHWFFECFLKKIDPNLNIFDILRTIYEHIAIQISKILNSNKIQNVLITGGGAKNNFLIELIKQKTQCQIVIPSEELIDFKEAIIFAFLGFLRWKKIPNCLSSVTGADFDNIGGAIYFPKSNKL